MESILKLAKMRRLAGIFIFAFICFYLLNAGGFLYADNRLFPGGLEDHTWLDFKASGFSWPVTGVIYRGKPHPVSGVSLGGLDTGCVDIESTGLYGYSTIFNELFPRGLWNVPMLGMSVNGKTWVMTTGQAKKYSPKFGDTKTWPPIDYLPYYFDNGLEGVARVDSIDYFGHYPIVDMEYNTDAPVSVGMRGWSPFMPGDSKTSMLPAAVFEVSVRNRSDEKQKVTLAFNFPGFAITDKPNVKMTTFNEILGESKYGHGSTIDPWLGCMIINPAYRPSGPVQRQEIKGKLNGVYVASYERGNSWEMSYTLACIGGKVRSGGALDNDGSKWAAIDDELPAVNDKQSGASLACDLKLKVGESQTVRFVISWHAPNWMGGGAPYLGGNMYTHMYSKYYPNSLSTAEYVASNHKSLLKRVINWQEAIYMDKDVPGWLADSLINMLYLITEDSVWGQAKGPISWADNKDGVFGLNECPRGCPQIECIPCTFYGGLPLVYFFPECALSTLRATLRHQYVDGRVSWIFGGFTLGTPPYELDVPGKGYQTVLNGVCYVVAADRYWRVTGDDSVLSEFWESLKKCTDFSFSLRPEYGLSQIIAMPAPGSDKHGMGDTEWFEAPKPGWKGYVTHAGGIRMAQALIMRRMARKMGDREYLARCDTWLGAGAKALEEYLWAGNYYLNFNEPETGLKSDMVFGYQLDGEWIADNHGLAEGVFPKNRVDTTLATIRRINDPISKSGVSNYANPDGSVAQVGGYGPYSYFPPELMMLAMNYMYEGHKDYGVELLRKCLDNYVCDWGYAWDAGNIIRGDVDTGQRHFGADYYQNLMLWSVPAALSGQDLTGPCLPGGLVDRVIKAGQSK